MTLGKRLRLIEPADRERYLARCAHLASALQAQRPTAIIIVDACRMVLVSAFGSRWRVVLYLVHDSIVHDWNRFQGVCWRAWQKHIRRKSDDEMTELMNAAIEERTGVDMREWPSEISDY